MIAHVAVLLASLATTPQVPPHLRLPEPTAAPAPAAAVVQRPLAEIERFQRDLELLRGTPAPETERALQHIAQSYPDVEALILQRLPAAGQRELMVLMVASRRFGTARIADEILFQLLARPIGDATRELLETMVALQGVGAKKALRDCVRGRVSGTRRIATEILARLASADDLEFALELADAQLLDLRLCGVELLGAVPVERARQRLVQLLSREPTVAGAAAAQLQRLGAAAQPALRAVLDGPAIDRSHAYAAFVLASADVDGTLLPPPAAVAPLRQFLAGADPIARALAAVALAQMAYHGQAADVPDRTIVAALLDVVAPAAFVPNFELLRRPAEQALRQLTGRSGAEALAWRSWWGDAANSFAGLRARIDLGPDDAAFAVVTLRSERRQVRLVGEQLADLPPQPGILEYVLDAAAMRQLVDGLRAVGFMRPGAIAMPVGLPTARSLELVVRTARSMLAAPAEQVPAFEELIGLVVRTADAELWQQLRHPTDEPERGAFWRAERRFRTAQADPKVLDRRCAQRAIRLWPQALPEQRALVLAWWLALPYRRELLDEADGLALLDVVRKIEPIGEQELVLLELAATAPGDRVWREGVDLAARLPEIGRSAVDRLFAVLGADRVLQALLDERPSVRRAAIDQVVEARDPRAADRLIAMFDDPDQAVRRAAVFASGQLGLAAARGPLVDRIVADDTEPALRRDALAALGRIGGEGVFAVLQRALASPVQADRDAALRGLGELKDERAATQLAQIFTASLGTTTGEVARSYLQRMGARYAVPALRQQLEVQNAAVRNEVVLMLGGYFDPQVVPDLTDLLQRRHEPLLAAALLAGTTGLDLDSVADPVTALRDWHRDHRLEPQWRWLLQALQREKITTSLDDTQFAPSAGLVAVPELARLLVEAEPGRVRSLAAAVLRATSGEDFGQITPATSVEIRTAIAGRYRELYENARAARGR